MNSSQAKDSTCALFDLGRHAVPAGLSAGFFPGARQDPPQAHLTVIYLEIFPARLGYATWAFFQPKMPASQASSFLYIQPILSIAIAFFWIGEIPSLLSLAGGIIVLTGWVLVSQGGVKQKGDAVPIS
jgi:drug/metabolite transporter (DMT)-like permease